MDQFTGTGDGSRSLSEIDRFEVPAARQTAEQHVRHSRFIATVGPVRDRASFQALLEHEKKRWPDANHHCWAYLAGAPGDLRYADKSDDGEPRGTAGRPILTVLEHCGLGFVAVVVSRYFGGVKLGAGGLVRAYGQSAGVAVAQVARRTEFVTRCLKVTVPYTLLSTVDHWLESTHIAVDKRVFDEAVHLTLRVPLGDLETTNAALARLGQGAISVVAD